MTKPFVHLPLARPLTVLHIEATGISPGTDRIIEIAAIQYTPQGDRERFHRLVNPGIPIPAPATSVHGLTDADVAEFPPSRPSPYPSPASYAPATWPASASSASTCPFC